MQDTLIASLKAILAEKPVPLPPPDPEEEAKRVVYQLEWIDSNSDAYYPQEPQPEKTLTEAREELIEEMRRYCARRKTGEPEEKPVLLVKAQPGLGKTYAGVQLAQELAQKGHRVLYLMPQHDHFVTLQNMPHFDPELWYHWLSYNAPYAGGEDGDQMCRYAPAAGEWMSKGYPLTSMCESLCPLYKSQCPYRQQAHMPHKIIAGVHEHAVTGLAIDGFYVTIIDEMPMRAFLSPREIPQSGIVMRNAGGPVSELQKKLLFLSVDNGRSYSGPNLMAEIAPLLSDVFAQVEINMLPDIPFLSTTEDVKEVGYWYLNDLLPLLAEEWTQYEAGAQDWMARVIVGKDGIRLLTRGDVWKNLPQRTVVIDATANKAMYDQMFPKRETRLYQPSVKMLGTIRQVVNRYYGISTATEGKQAEQAVELVKLLIEKHGYKRPAVVTFLAAEKLYQGIVGEDRTAHFYGQRGSNDFEDADALFVIGSPSPPDHMIMRDVAILNQERHRPYATSELKNGYFLPIRSVRLSPYNYWKPDGTQAARYVSGFWHDDDLRAMSDARREEELVQAIHRARPLVRECDVWLFSSIPIDVPLAGIYDAQRDDPDYSINAIIGCPPEIHWKHWGKLWPFLSSATGDFSTEDLAAVAGVKLDTARNAKWLNAILDHYPDRFEITKLSPITAKGLR